MSQSADSTRREALGKELENIMDEALNSFVPFETITYEHMSKNDSDVDFYIYDNGEKRIALECKNWGDLIRDSWIESEVISRFSKVPYGCLKFVIGHLAIDEEQRTKYFKKNNIFYYELDEQIKPEDSDDLKKFFQDNLIDEMAFLISGQRGKFRDDFVSNIKLKILGNTELLFEFPNGQSKHLNMKSREHIRSKAYQNYISDIVKIGEKPLDIIQWSISKTHGINCLFVPKKYKVFSDTTNFDVRDDNDSKLHNQDTDFTDRANKLGFDRKTKGLGSLFKMVTWESIQ